MHAGSALVSRRHRLCRAGIRDKGRRQTRAEAALLRHLVVSLDGVGRQCIGAGDLTDRSWLKRPLGELGRCHQQIAAELYRRTGPCRGGVRAHTEREQGWRRAVESPWWPRTRGGDDLARLLRMQRSEHRLIRKFASAASRVPSGNAHWCLLRGLYEVEHARTLLALIITQLRDEIQAGPSGAPAESGPANAGAIPRSSADGLPCLRRDVA